MGAKNIKFPKITEVINLENLDELSIKYAKIVYQKIKELYLENEKNINRGIYLKFFENLKKIVVREKAKLDAELKEFMDQKTKKEQKEAEKEQQATEEKKVEKEQQTTEEEKEAEKEHQATEEKKEAEKEYQATEVKKEAEKEHQATEEKKEVEKEYQAIEEKKEAEKEHQAKEVKKEAEKEHQATEVKKEAEKEYQATEEKKEAEKEHQATEEKKEAEKEHQATEEQKESLDNQRVIKNDENNVFEKSNTQNTQSNIENEANVVENNAEIYKKQTAKQEVKSDIEMKKDEKAEIETNEKSKKTDAEIGKNVNNNQMQKSNENEGVSEQNVEKEVRHKQEQNLVDEAKQGETKINCEENIKTDEQEGQNNKNIKSEDTQAQSTIKEEKNSEIRGEDIENNETVEDDNLDEKIKNSNKEKEEINQKINDLIQRSSFLEIGMKKLEEAKNLPEMNELNMDKSNPLINEAFETTYAVENSNCNQVNEKMEEIKENIFQQFMQEPSKNISNAYENKADEDINLITKLMNQDGNAFSKKKNKEYEYSIFDFIIIGNSIVKENKKNLSCKYIFLNYDDLKGEENIFLGNYKKDNIFITFIYIKDKNILLYLECSGKSDKEVKDDKIDDGFKEKFNIKDYELKKNKQFENLSENKKDEIICLNVLEYFLKLEEGEKRDNFINTFESQNFKEIINENENKNNISSNNPKYYTIECYNIIKSNEERTIKEVNIQEVYFIIYPKKIEKIKLELISGNINEDYLIDFNYKEKNIALKNLKEMRKYLEGKLTDLEKKDWDNYLEKLKKNIENLEDEENDEDD